MASPTASVNLVSPEEAVSHIRNGDRIVVTIGSNPRALIEAVNARAADLADCTFVISAPTTDPDAWWTGAPPPMRLVVECFSSVMARPALNARTADYSPTMFSRRFRSIDERQDEPVDVLLVNLSPPGPDGMCSFGSSAWNKAGFAKRARVVLGEVDPRLIRTAGNNGIPASMVTAFIAADTNFPSVPPRAPREPRPELAAIAANVAEIVKDGDTLQIGAGLTSTGLISTGVFNGHRDLGWHSEITPAGTLELVREGIMTGARKTFKPGKFVATALGVDPVDLAFAESNPDVEVHPVEWVNDPLIVCQHENMVAINNALSIDLTGQIAAESFGHRMWSGAGGQLEFVTGAVLAKNGKSITVMPSAALGGTVTRIVPELDPGAVVTVPRQFADYVVTEWGVAQLWGRSQRERARELIAVAHPDHRKDLARQAEELYG